MNKSKKEAQSQINTHLVQYSYLIYAPLSQKIVNLIKNTNITPNQLTITSLILGILSSVFFAFGYQLYLVIALIFLHLSILADFVDGRLSRKKNMASLYGAWLDSNIDRVVDPIIFLGISYGIYRSSGRQDIWFICSLAILSRLLVDVIYFITRIEIGYSFVKHEVNNDRVQQ